MRRIKIFRNIFRIRRFTESLKIAIKGILYLFFYHRNMRIIFLLGILAFLLGIFYQLRGIQLMILFATITIVFVAEIFNTTIELMLDMLKEEYHPKIRLIKDIAAAVVLISCLNAIATGYILFGRRILYYLTK